MENEEEFGGINGGSSKFGCTGLCGSGKVHSSDSNK